ncbi:MAG: YhcH/YjgK/YiaL family protein [Eubacteriales bacterium]|nr:YhcH/YjgK/YiaL family protein [Eubacteriales bacterium]
MIKCAVTELKAFLGLSPELDKAIGYLMKGEWRLLPHGRTEIDGENVYLNRFAYQTADNVNEPFETHFCYMDIHLLISGRERVSAAEPEKLAETQRDETEDYMLATGDAEQTTELRPGYALLVPPGEAHRTKEALEGACTVEKAVCKVKWNRGGNADLRGGGADGDRYTGCA